METENIETAEVIAAMKNFLTEMRPPEEDRDESDIAYKIEGQSIIIFEIRPQWNKPEIIGEHPFAMATYIKAENIWKVFYMNENSNWEVYKQKIAVNSIKEFTKLVEDDKYQYFFG
jgi:hypothetical protein